MKLVRSKIPGHHPKNQYRMATNREMPLLLLLKIQEEAAEVAVAGTDEEMLEELADVLEVVHAIAGKMGISVDDVERKRRAKRARLGGFDGDVLISRGGS